MHRSIVFILALMLPFSRQNFSQHFTRKVGTWRYDVTSSAFTGQRLCRLYSRDARLEGGAIIFQYPKRVDTSAAWVKIDGGTAHRWQEFIPILILGGTVLPLGDIENPSLGRVYVPLDVVKDAHLIEIVSDSDSQQRRFSVPDFMKALRAAQADGCRFQGVMD